MPCWDRFVQYKTKLDMKNVNLQALAEALKMMPEVSTVRIIGQDIRVALKDGSQCTVTVTETEVQMEGWGAQQIKGKVAQYYTALVQAQNLKKQGFQVSMQQVGEKLRIQAKR